MKKNSQSDHELILGYLAGNDASFEILLKRYKNKVFATIFGIVHDRYIAEELFQDTFIKVCQQIREQKYVDDGRFPRWIVRIARNICIDHLRKVKNKPIVTDSEGNDVLDYLLIREDSSEDLLIRKEEKAFVRDMIKQLPEDQRQVIVLKHYADMSFKEIATFTNVSINTALGRMRYALINMRKMMMQKQLAAQRAN